MAAVDRPAPVPLTGQLVDGRFRVGEVIGRGAMSDVYRAVDERLDREVAVKVLRLGSPDPERFAEETALLCSLDHPHLVRLHDAGEHHGVPFLVLNLVPGTLAQRLGHGPLPPEGVAQIGGEIGAALDYLHGRGIVHRDIKPSNILLREDGTACLADLGAALSLDGPRLTATGLTIGTPMYLAPEQAAAQDVGPPADIYSLGLVLLEAATGAPAFSGTNQETMGARLARSPNIPDQLPAALRSALQSMTALDPQLRPNAAEVRTTLGGFAPADLERPEGAAADTAVMGPPTAVMAAAEPDAPLAPDPPPVVLALQGAGRGAAGWFREDRRRALWAGLVVLVLVALVAGLASANDGPSVPTGVEADTTVPTTATTLPTTLPPTTVAVVAPPDRGECGAGCGNKDGHGKGEKKD